VEAIFAEDDVPDSQNGWIALNRELSAQWQPIIERKPAPPDADDWAKVKEKRQLLEK
jgi:ferredoxin